MNHSTNCTKTILPRNSLKAKTLKLTNYSKLNKGTCSAIMEAQMEKDGNYYMEGILDDIDGYGFKNSELF